MGELRVPTRRERQREATYDEIVQVSADLLAEGAELSLRAVAARMGVTAPALYRYVANYQELVELVAFELDKSATSDYIAAAAERYPEDDPAARLTAACIGFRRWALGKPREFSLVFLNPIASGETERREVLTLATSGHYMTDLLYQIWERYQHPIPTVEELEPAVQQAVLEPLIPAKCDHIPPEQRGLLWLDMVSWSALYGVVTLETSRHCDPRVIESGALFRETLLSRLRAHGLEPERERLTAIIDAEMATS